MNHSRTPVLNPPKALLKRAFNLAFNSVNLIASDPLLPLQLRIIKAPTFWGWSTCWLAFLQLKIVAIVEGRNGHWCCCIACTVTPQILHAVDSIRGGSRCCWAVAVILNLHSSITASASIWSGSEIIHDAFFRKIFLNFILYTLLKLHQLRSLESPSLFFGALRLWHSLSFTELLLWEFC